MYSAALDAAGNSVSIAVADRDNKVILQKTVPMRGREAAKLPVWVAGELESAGLSLRQITHWSVGAGPGSFTGLRLIAALVSGWAFQQPEVHTRCVPGAVAFAAAAGVAPGEKAFVLYDGRNHEMICYAIEADSDGEFHPGGKEAIFNREQAAEFFSGCRERLIVPAADAAAILALLPENSTVQQVETPDTAALIRARVYPYDNDLTKLIYIRPAVTTAPRQ